MGKLFENRKLGFWLACAAAAVAVVGTVAYLIIYMATATETVDRVFSWMTFGFMIGGAVVSVLTEALRLRFGPILATVCFGLAFANHLVEFAYPLADVLTGVPFFGGNYTLALVFVIVFGFVAVCQVASAFLEHNSDK